MVKHQNGSVAILQVLDFLLEHRGLLRAITVDQREAALGIARQYRFEYRKDRRDAAASCDTQVVASGRGGALDAKASLRRHDRNGQARFGLLVQPGGEKRRPAPCARR